MSTRQQRTQRELSDRVLNITDNGAEMITFFHNIMADENVKLPHRMEAAKWLSDRAWGKSPDILHLDAGGIFQDLLEATDAELIKIAAEAVIPENFELSESKLLTGETLEELSDSKKLKSKKDKGKAIAGEGDKSEPLTAMPR